MTADKQWHAYPDPRWAQVLVICPTHSGAGSFLIPFTPGYRDHIVECCPTCSAQPQQLELFEVAT